MTDLILREVRKDFGLRLREARLAARLTGKQLAVRVGWPRTKVSKVELGLQPVSEDDLMGWLAGTGASPETAGRLRGEWAGLDARHQQARSQSRTVPMAKLRQSLDSSYEVVSLRWYESALIPGSLQTRAYARRIMESHRTLDPSFTEIDEAVELRAQRAAILTSKRFGRFQYVLLESALRNEAFPATVWCAQINHLIRLSELGLPFGILPMTSPMVPDLLSGSFVIYDDDRREVWSVVSGRLVLTRALEVGWAVRVFGMLWDDSVKGADARALLARSRDDAAAVAAVRGRPTGDRTPRERSIEPARPSGERSVEILGRRS